MNFWVIVCALILNLATGWLFKPYTGWVTRIHVSIAKRLSHKKYKTSVAWGRIAAILGLILIWIAVDFAIMYLEAQSKIYSYIVYGIVIYFCVCFGQTAGIIRKFAGNTKNDTFVRQLFADMLIPNANKIDRTQYKKVFAKASARLFAEKIIMPALLIMFFGAGAAVAYSFINTFTHSDSHHDVAFHGYASLAISVNRIVSIPGYAVLSLLLWAIKWIFNMKFSIKGRKYTEKCSLQLYIFGKENEFSDEYIKIVNFVVYAIAVLLFLLMISTYIFIQTVLAALGLDEYWDFWSGANINKE